MYRAAVSAGAKVRFNSRVDSIDPDSGTVTLSSGDVLEADIIVGADGQFGLSRREFLEETKPDTGTLLMYQ
jgi:salicylate hydroxylase